MSTARRSPAKAVDEPTFRISDDLDLPIEAVVETFAVLGRRGSGKTSTAVVMAEEMIGAGMPVVVIDPLGVWWGLRSSADGKGEGLPVVIFGGDHADVPLSENAGEVVADTLVAGRFPAILDVSGLSKTAMRRFMADFFERLYAKNREALHVIVDEADLMVPQRLPAEGLRLFSALDDIQRRGRARGLGTTLITQRPAVINKDLLSQAEVLVAMSFRSKRDVAAIDDWVRLKADEEEAVAVKASLASLPVGCGWVWSPSLLGVLSKVQIRRRWTFDSSATPKPGQPRPVAEAFATIDTAALGAQITALTEQATASDPKHLRAEVARLNRQVEVERTRADRAETDAARSVNAAPTGEPVEVRVEVPALSDADRALLDSLVQDANQAEDRLVSAVETLTRTAQAATDARSALSAKVDDLRTAVDASAQPSARQTSRSSTGPSVQPPSRRASAAVDHRSNSDREKTTERSAAPERATDTGRKLTKAERKILTALAQQPGRNVVQVALLTGYSHKSGGYRNALSTLRSSGFIEGSGSSGMDATPIGLEALGSYDPLPSGAALREWWKDVHLGKAEREILDVIADAYPRATHVEDIATQTSTGYSPTSGGYRNALSRLRSLELAHNESPGMLVMSSTLAD